MRTGSALRGVALTLFAILLAGCTSPPTQGRGEDYVSDDGTVTEYSPDNRGETIEFSGATDNAGLVSTEDFKGSVLVVNFWYAACPPCRLEAPWLQELYEEFEPEGVDFLGVNIRDSAETSLAFAETFGITYPSVIDTDSAVALAFSGVVAPTAVPTTIVLDRDGRPAARIVGLLDKSVLRTLIRTVIDEANR